MIYEGYWIHKSMISKKKMNKISNISNKIETVDNTVDLEKNNKKQDEDPKKIEVKNLQNKLETPEDSNFMTFKENNEKQMKPRRSIQMINKANRGYEITSDRYVKNKSKMSEIEKITLKASKMKDYSIKEKLKPNRKVLNKSNGPVLFVNSVSHDQKEGFNR